MRLVSCEEPAPLHPILYTTGPVQNQEQHQWKQKSLCIQPDMIGHLRKSTNDPAARGVATRSKVALHHAVRITSTARRADRPTMVLRGFLSWLLVIERQARGMRGTIRGALPQHRKDLQRTALRLHVWGTKEHTVRQL